MKSLALRIKKANQLLAPYAVPHGKGLGRVHKEDEDETRFPFERDRDRILHTQAFRRLKHKTQVFVAGHGDHYRTRITHTLEVAQISRGIARTLGLNEDLAEAIALAHDLGHTPFGHAGEEAMNICMKPFSKRFEHNEQSLRVVRFLESRSSSYAGLNLNREVLEGLMKHRSSTPLSDPTPPRSPSLEAQVVNVADEIAYTAHDADDGLRAGLFDTQKLGRTKLGKLAYKKAKKRGSEMRSALVNTLITDLYKETERMLKLRKIRTLSDVYDAEFLLVRFSSGMETKLAELRRFLWKNLYLSTAVRRQALQGQTIIKDLFAAYIKRPPKKVKELVRSTGAPLEDAVKDYIAGMTDPFAMESWEAI